MRPLSSRAIRTQKSRGAVVVLAAPEHNIMHPRCPRNSRHQAEARIGVRRPRTIVTVWWPLTVCEATARPGLPWVGLPRAHGPTPAAQAQRLPDRAARAEGATYLRCIPSPGSTITLRIRYCIHAAAQAGRSSLMPLTKLICSTATYLFCRCCSNGGPGSAYIAAGQSTGDRRRADLVLFGDHSNNLTVKQGKRDKLAGPGPVSSPLAGSNRLPSPYHLSTR
jgi:hypothetical protein